MIYKKHIKPYQFLFAILVAGYLLFLTGTTFFKNSTNATIKNFTEHTNTLYEHPFTVHSNALELKLKVLEIRNENLISLQDNKNKVDFIFVTQSDFALIDRLMQEIKKEFLGEKSKTEELQVAVNQWESTVTNFRNLVQAKHTIEARNYLDVKVTPSYQVLDEKLNYILNYSQIKAETIVANANSAAVALNKSLFNSYLLSIALMTIAGGIGAGLPPIS